MTDSTATPPLVFDAFGEMVDRFRRVIRGEEVDRWIDQAFLRQPPILAPIVVEPIETLEDNLRRVFNALSEDEKKDFRVGLSRAVLQYWPTKDVGAAGALRDIFRLARVSAHYGLLKWVGSQIIDLFTKPKTASDLKILSETVAAMGSLERWIPELHEDGPDHRFILGKLHELFNKLGTHKALSFLDAALLMPAVRYDREKWPALVCAALERYDVTGTEVIPDDWPTFGSASHPEGVGVYDFRTLLARVVRDVTVTQFEIGTKALVAKSVAGDPASSSLLEILEKEKLLMEKREIVSRFPQAAFPFVNIVEPARIFLMGPAYIYAVHQGLFRFVTGTDITEWSQRNWALATEMLEQSFDNFSRFAPITLAFWPGRERVVRDVPEAVAPAEMESAEKRSYVKFRTATSPIIRATTKRGRNA